MTEATIQQKRPIKRFVVVHRTAAGYLTAVLDFDTRAEAEEDAANRASATGAPHWVSEVVAEAQRGSPIVRPFTGRFSS